MNCSSERSRKTNGTEAEGVSTVADDADLWFVSTMKCAKSAGFSVVRGMFYISGLFSSTASYILF